MTRFDAVHDSDAENYCKKCSLRSKKNYVKREIFRHKAGVGRFHLVQCRLCCLCLSCTYARFFYWVLQKKNTIKISKKKENDIMCQVLVIFLGFEPYAKILKF